MKNIKIILLLVAVSLLNTSCLVDDEPLNQETEFSTTTYAVGFNEDTNFTNLLTTGDIVLFKQPLNLIGGGTYSDTPEITVSYVLDNTLTTAIAGVDYDFVSTSGDATIPTNRTFGTIDLNVYTGAIDVDNPKKIVLNLTGSNIGVVASEREVVTITLSGVCFSNNGGSYNVTATRATGQVYNFPNETITQIDDAEYLTVSTGRFSSQAGGTDITVAPNFAARNGFTFTENCDVITIESQPLGDTFGGNPVSGSGTVDPVTGDITMNVIVGGESTYTVIYTKI